MTNVIKPSVEAAYVAETERVLDPTLLEKSAIERMPTPSGWRLLVLPYKGKGTTKGGIHLTRDTLDQQALATVVAYVIKMGPLCFNDKAKYGDVPWCQEKEWVLIGRYAGARFKLEEGDEVRIINDDEIIGKILDPDDIVSYR